MTTIVSIHQPNNDLFLMFDKIYVLAKGGVCVYSGTPFKLRQHLSDCDIDCHQNEVPIEKLLKISSEENNPKIKQMIVLSKFDFKVVREDPNLQQINGNEYRTQRFTAIDFYYLLKRTMRHKYICNWKSLVMLFLIYQIFILTLKSMVNPEMIRPNGCLELDFTFGCNQTLEALTEENLLKDNIRYNFYFVTFLSIIVVINISVNFCHDFNQLKNESKNGKVILIDQLAKLLKLIEIFTFRLV